MYLYTTNYEDFRSIVQNFFGKTAVLFHGNRDGSHQNEHVVIATNALGSTLVVFETSLPLPEAFQNELQNAVLLKEVGVLKWG